MQNHIAECLFRGFIFRDVLEEGFGEETHHVQSWSHGHVTSSLFLVQNFLSQCWFHIQGTSGLSTQYPDQYGCCCLTKHVASVDASVVLLNEIEGKGGGEKRLFASSS